MEKPECTIDKKRVSQDDTEKKTAHGHTHPIETNNKSGKNKPRIVTPTDTNQASSSLEPNKENIQPNINNDKVLNPEVSPLSRNSTHLGEQAANTHVTSDDKTSNGSEESEHISNTIIPKTPISVSNKFDALQD